MTIRIKGLSFQNSVNARRMYCSIWSRKRKMQVAHQMDRYRILILSSVVKIDDELGLIAEGEEGLAALIEEGKEKQNLKIVWSINIKRLAACATAS